MTNQQKGGIATLPDHAQKAKFDLGRVVFTADVVRTLHPDEILDALHRHTCGDWGEVCEEDVRENEFSLKHGLRIFSAYETQNAVRFWIITEADRLSTTVLLPSEY